VLEPVQLSSGRSFSTFARADLEAARATGAFDSVIDLDFIESIYVRDGDRIEPLRVQPGPTAYLSTLGAQPVYGRDFKESDSGTTAVLLSYKTWARRYGRNVAILDTTIAAVDGRAMHVIGVLPSSFRTASATAFFRPPDLLMAARPADAGPGAFTPIARLADGVSPAEAQARLSAIRGVDLSPGKTELRVCHFGIGWGDSPGQRWCCCAPWPCWS
jgi:hypothetical protein